MKVLITGGTGSLGRYVTKQFLNNSNIDEIRLFSRSEQKHVRTKCLFNSNKVTYVIGDIRDKDSIRKAMNEIDYVVHLAAMKVIPECELHPWECVQSNIIGTQNLIDIAIEFNIKKFVAVSTDKASVPSNVYGYSKALVENLVLTANDFKNENNTSFYCIRPGNMLYSSGSVVPFFERQIRDKGEVTVTDLKMTRFFLTLKDVANIITNSLFSLNMKNKILVPKMDSFYIEDLVKVLFDVDKKPFKVKVIGKRSGEKIDEDIFTEGELDRVEEELFYLDDISCYIIDKNKHFNKEAVIKSKSDAFTMSGYAIVELLLRAKEEEKELLGGLYSVNDLIR